MKASPLIPAVSRRASAFTLIELLVVVTVIAILAALTLQTSGYIQEKAASSRAKTEIAALEAALESYKIDNGTYPAGDGGVNSTRELIKVLALNPINDKTKIYMEIPMNMLQKQTTGGDILGAYSSNATGGALVDPFGNTYHYFFSPTGTGANSGAGGKIFNGPAFPDLWSQGKKNSAYSDENVKKWITNW